jgi:N-acetylglucosaminyldiphosphoundecaprenol N-acetyl-beta-D-mannosaminyltransferase
LINCFNINLEFDREKLNNRVIDALQTGQKGYVCVVDGNALTHAAKSLGFREIINHSITNACDGSSIAMMVNRIYKQKFCAYTGPEIFSHFIRSGYRQLFLGNTEQVLQELKHKFIYENLDISDMEFTSLPFLALEEFDYQKIGNQINCSGAQIVWVSLGAPKQEYFIGRLIPFIDSAVLFAIGAAFNLYIGSGKNSRAPGWMRSLHLEWVFRVIKEPGRVGKRAYQYLRIIPVLYREERKKAKTNKFKYATTR